MSFLRKILEKARPRARLLLVIGILALIGVCIYLTVRSLRGAALYRDAEQALLANDLEKARSSLLACLEIRPNNPEVHFLLARTARRAGDYQAASAYLKSCRECGGIPEAIELEYGLAAFQSGHLSDNLERVLWAYVRKGHPDAVPILEAMARGYLKTFRLREAHACLTDWLKRRPNDIEGLLLRAQTLEKSQRTQEVLADYRRIFELDPNYPGVREKLGEALFKANLFEEAEEHFTFVRQQKPHDAVVLLGLARCYKATGKNELAQTVLDSLLKEFPDHDDALVERGKLALDSMHLERAETDLRRAVERSPYNREAVYSFILCLGRLKKQSELENWKGRLERIDTSLKRLAELTDKITQTPNDADLRCQAGQIFLDNGNDKEGVRWLQSALEEDPGHRETHRVLRDFYRGHGRADLAAVHEQALAKPQVKQQTGP